MLHLITAPVSSYLSTTACRVLRIEQETKLPSYLETLFFTYHIRYTLIFMRRRPHSVSSTSFLLSDNRRLAQIKTVH